MHPASMCHKKTTDMTNKTRLTGKTIPLKALAIYTLTVLCGCPSAAQRKMIHPGISYTQADIDRMKAMIAAKQEPYYTAYRYLLSDRYTNYKDYDVKMLKDANGRPSLWFSESVPRQYWFGQRGQIALNNALLWKLTGDTKYADKAVTVLNSYIGIHSTVTYGTNCLDNSACTPLIEAAELVRDYEGWKAEDQQGFKDFLVYPRYSTKESMYAKHATADPATSECTVYWNIFMGDPARHGNQGLYGMRCMMAMGIYLDNDTIYERALNKLLSKPHRKDDLPYAYGPFSSTGWTASAMPAYHWNQSLNTRDALFDWQKHGGTWGNLTIGDEEDYGSDDELKYWIYDNGQTQEAARDQGHVMDGMCNMVEIAKVAWNQGDDMFTQYDDRLLKGITYAAKYNYSWRNNHYKNGNFFDAEDYEPTVENGEFYDIKSRNNGFWSKKICPYSENSMQWTRGKMFGTPLQMLMAYQVRLGRDKDSVLWLQRAWDMNRDTLNVLGSAKFGYNDCMIPEQLGDYRTVWMAGDAGTFSNKNHISGIPMIPGTIKAVDYDFFNNVVSGNGRTYFTTGQRTDELYRTEGGMQIAAEGNDYVITDLKDGSWMNYTFSVGETGTYKVSVRAKTAAGASIGFAIDNGEIQRESLSNSDDYKDIELGDLKIKAGARVLRIYVDGADNAVTLKDITITKVETDMNVIAYRWNSLDYHPVTGKGVFLNDQGSTTLYSTSYASRTQPLFTIESTDMSYNVSTNSLYLVMEGNNFDHAAMTSATYRLEENAADETKTSSNGISNHLSTTDYNGTKIVAWKLDSTINKRVAPLLKVPYTSGNADYVLRGLTFLVYGTSGQKTTEVTGIHFYTLDEIRERYPELYITLGIGETPSVNTIDEEEPIYDLSGRRMNSKEDLAPGIYISKNRKFSVRRTLYNN